MTLALALAGIAISEVLMYLILAIIALAIVAIILYVGYAIAKYIRESINRPAPPGTDSFDRTWERTTPDAPAIPAPPIAIPLDNVFEKVHPTVLPQVKPLVKNIAQEREIEKGKYKVYDIHINISGLYRDYVRSAGFTEVQLLAGSIYKYGTTSLWSVIARYQFHKNKGFTNEKDSYILKQLIRRPSPKMSGLEWYIKDVDETTAKALEKLLIGGYALAHNGNFPPANTGLY